MKKTVQLAATAAVSAMLALPSALAAPPSKFFTNYGVAVPVSQNRGNTGTKTKDGKEYVIVEMMDHRGGYGILQIDAETGEAKDSAFPFKLPYYDAQYCGILSSGNKVYTHFAEYFTEYDPEKQEFTACHRTKPRMALSMAEDYKGLVWGATYPNSGLFSYNPETKEFIDYGSINQENWPQYPNTFVVGKDGWIYVGIGNTKGQLIAFQPSSRKAVKLIPEDKRYNPSIVEVREYTDGKIRAFYKESGHLDNPKVYGWFELADGKATSCDAPTVKPVAPPRALRGWDGIMPSGRRATIDLKPRTLKLTDPKTKETKEVKFTYKTEGSSAMGVVRGTNGKFYVPGMWPFYFSEIDLKTGKRIIHDPPGWNQFNIMIPDRDTIWVGAYCGGLVYGFDPSKPWTKYRPDENKQSLDKNPAYYGKSNPDINRPYTLAITPDGKILAMGGAPDYGRTGGGLGLLNTETQKLETLSSDQVIPNESIYSLATISNDQLLIGTTIGAGTGGEVKANECTLAIFDFPTKKVIWKEKPFPGESAICSMTRLADGSIIGLSNKTQLFRFDPATKTIVAKARLPKVCGHAANTNGQGPRLFFQDKDGSCYLLCSRGIAKIDTTTCKATNFVKVPVHIENGGVIYDGKLFFVTASDLCSLDLAAFAQPSSQIE